LNQNLQDHHQRQYQCHDASLRKFWHCNKSDELQRKKLKQQCNDKNYASKMKTTNDN
jgi:hypothetical protein